MASKKPSAELLDLLNQAIAREIQVSVQYMWQHVLWKGVQGYAVKDAFKMTAIAEMKHAEAIAERLNYLGGIPTTKPTPIFIGATLKQMLEADVKAEEEAISMKEDTPGRPEGRGTRPRSSSSTRSFRTRRSTTISSTSLLEREGLRRVRSRTMAEMKGILFIAGSAAVASAFLLSPSVLRAQGATGAYPNLSPAEARDLLGKRSGDPDFILLDVRTQKEFDAERIAGAGDRRL